MKPGMLEAGSVKAGNTAALRKLFRHPSGAVGADGTVANGDLLPSTQDHGVNIQGARAIALLVTTDENGSGVDADTDIRPWVYSRADDTWRALDDEEAISGVETTNVWAGGPRVIELGGLFDRIWFQVVDKGDNLHLIDVWCTEVSY